MEEYFKDGNKDKNEKFHLLLETFEIKLLLKNLSNFNLCIKKDISYKGQD